MLRRDEIHPEGLADQFNLTQPLQERTTPQRIGLDHQNLKKLLKTKKKDEVLKSQGPSVEVNVALENTPFVHLHNHTHFRFLQATSRINQLVEAAANDGMPALAITDHGNLMGTFHFIKAIERHNATIEEGQKMKPIVGCEFYVCDDHKDKTRRDDGYQVVFLENKSGYHNLAKLTSAAYVDGFYYVRIDRQLITQYKNDLIVLTGNTYGEVPSKILNVGDRQAEEALSGGMPNSAMTCILR